MPDWVYFHQAFDISDLNISGQSFERRGFISGICTKFVSHLNNNRMVNIDPAFYAGRINRIIHWNLGDFWKYLP
jgi:hypothetical protein